MTYQERRDEHTARLKEKISSQVASVIEKLYPNAKQVRDGWQIGNAHGDAGSSLHITEDGLWTDRADVDGNGGWLIDLWKERFGVTLNNAFDELARFAGMQTFWEEEQERRKNERANNQKPGARLHKPIKQNIERVLPSKHWTAASVGSGVTAYLNKRGINASTIEDFRIGMLAYHHGIEGEVIVLPFGEKDKGLQMVKYLGVDRPKGKKQTRTNKDPLKVLFGKHLISSDCDKLTICEGEIDAMTLHQCGFSTVSIPYGVGNNDFLENDFEWLERFEEIYLAFDNDDAGRKGMESLIPRLGRERCFSVAPPKGTKDWNDALCKNEDIAKAFFESLKPCDPESLQTPGELAEEIIANMYPTDSSEGMYYNPLMPDLPVRPGEITLYTGINGHGKSEYLLQQMSMLGAQGAKVCIASLEIKTAKSLERMLKQFVGKSMIPPESIRSLSKEFNAWLLFYNHVGSATVDVLLEDFAYAYKRYGTTQFVIDSLLKLGIDEDDYTKQRRTVEKMTEFVHKYPATHIHLVAHPKKCDDESKAPNKMSVMGSGHLTNLVWNIVSIWRNKSKEDSVRAAIEDGAEEIEALNQYRDTPNTFVSVLKNREGSVEPKSKLLYRLDCHTFFPMGSHLGTTLLDLMANLVATKQARHAEIVKNRNTLGIKQQH